MTSQRRVPGTTKEKTEPTEPTENGAEQPMPEAFVIPTDLLVATAQLVARIPAGQVGDVLIRLQRLEPLVVK